MSVKPFFRINSSNTLKALLISICSISPLAAEEPITPPMVNIPAGDFMMGSNFGKDRNKPRHLVSLPAFQMGKYLVTVHEFRKYVLETGNTPKANCVDSLNENWMSGKYEGTASWDNNRYLKNDYQPVTCISWHDATTYANWLSEKTGIQYRLPTEEEWEYAATANTKSRFSWGDDPNLTQACFYGNFGDQAGEYFGSQQYGASYVGYIGHANCNDGEGFNSIVGLYRPNPFGLYDMHGNVKQYLGSCYYPGYQTRTTKEMNIDSCETVAFRGTIWHFIPEPNYFRGGFLKSDAPNAILGFRLAIDGSNDTSHQSSNFFEEHLQKAQDKHLASRIEIPAIPNKIQFKQEKNNTYKLSWQPNDDKNVIAYEVYRSIVPYAHLLGGFYQKHYKKIETVPANNNKIYINQIKPDDSFIVVAKTKDAISLPSEALVTAKPKSLDIPGRLNVFDAVSIENAHLKHRVPKNNEPELYYLLRYTGLEQTATNVEFKVNVKKSAWYSLNYRGRRGGKGEFFKLWRNNKLISNIHYDKEIDDKKSNRHKVFLEQGNYNVQMTIVRETPDLWSLAWLDFKETQK